MLLRWGTPVLALILALRLAVIFLTGHYDWDLDHELYFGQRLLAGEWIWTKEFHDKLPFLQVISMVPAWFESVQAWRLISLGSCLVAAVAMIRLVPLIWVVPSIERHDECRLLNFVALLYLVLSTVMPGDLTHINPMAGAFALIAALLALLLLRQDVMSGPGLIAVLLLAGFMAAVAISIRPYLMAPLVVVALWGAVAPFIFVHTRRFLPNLAIFLGFGATALGWGLVLNLAPYSAMGRTDLFWAGMAMLGQDINPLSFYGTFRYFLLDVQHPLTFVLWAGVVLSGAMFVIGYRRGSALAPLVVLSFLSVGALFGYVAQHHWWPHYMNFFVPFFTLTILFMLGWLAEGRLRLRASLSVVMALGLAGIVATAGFWSVKTLVDFVRQPSLFTNKDDPKVAAFQAYRLRTDTRALPFLSPKQIKLHWKLHEPRHGFPHAANTDHIFNGWWQGIARSDSFATPATAEEYCALVQSQGPAVVVDDQTSPVIACLSGVASSYREVAQLPVAGQAVPLIVFRRLETPQP